MSSDVDAVIELLERWRDAEGVGRLRIGVDASRTIAQLSPERKRALAIEVAERVAPQLVPAIRAESGDLTAEQVGAVVDLLRRAERQELDDLVRALRSGEIGEALDLVDDAIDVVAPPDPRTEAPPEGVAEPESRTAPTSEPAAAGEPTPAAAGDVEAEDDEPTVTDVSPAVAAAAAERAGDVEITEDGSLELDVEEVRRRMEEEAAARAEQYRDTSRDVPDRPAYRAPDLDFSSDDGDELELPDPSVEPVAPLHERMDVAGPSRGGRGAAGTLRAGPVSSVVAAVTATDDGYRRRRAALATIRDGRMEADDVVPVVRSFDRATDRSWVAGAALDAGIVGPGVLDDLDLSEPAVARLRRRSR